MPPPVADQVIPAPTGWEAPSGSNTTVSLPADWGGVVWARTGCDFDTTLPGKQQCVTGGCDGGLLCRPTTDEGVPPAARGEWCARHANHPLHTNDVCFPRVVRGSAFYDGADRSARQHLGLNLGCSVGSQRPKRPAANRTVQ